MYSQLTIDEKKKNIISKANAASELEKTKDAMYVSGILAHVVRNWEDQGELKQIQSPNN